MEIKVEKITENELKITPSTNLQIKFQALEINEEEILNDIKNVLGLGGFELTSENSKETLDTYFDSDTFALKKANCLLRRRQNSHDKQGKSVLTVKLQKKREEGEFVRDEYEEEFSNSDFNLEKLANFSKFRKNILSDYTDIIFSPKIIISTLRKNYLVTKNNQKFRLSLDRFIFENCKNQEKSKEKFEIELEALNDFAIEEIPKIKKYSLELLIKSDFTYSSHSKYESAVQYFKLENNENYGFFKNWYNRNKHNLEDPKFIIAVLALSVTVIGLAIKYF